MKTLFSIIVLVLISLSLSAQDEFSLNEAINYAMENSTTSKQGDIKILDAEARIKETTAIGLPKLNASVDYAYNYKIQKVVIPDFADPTKTQELEFGTNHSASAGLDFSTLLFDAQYIYGLRAARAFKAMTRSETEQGKRDVRYNVAKAYLGSWILQENLGIIQKNIDNLKKVYRETQIIYENGFAEKLDVDRLELSVRNLQTEYDNLNRSYDLALDQVKFLMNYPMEENIILTEDFYTKLAEARMIKANDIKVDITDRPENEVFREAVGINEINVKRLKGGYLPNLVLFGNYRAFLSRNSLFSSDEPGWLGAGSVGARINVPIFDGFEKKAGIQRAKLNLQNVQTNQEQFEQAATMEVRNAKMRLFNAQQILNERETSLALAEEIYEVTQIKYKEGIGSSLETTQAERELYTSQAQLLQAQYELMDAKIDLDKAEGHI